MEKHAGERADSHLRRKKGGMSVCDGLRTRAAQRESYPKFKKAKGLVGLNFQRGDSKPDKTLETGVIAVPLRQVVKFLVQKRFTVCWGHCSVVRSQAVPLQRSKNH